MLKISETQKIGFKHFKGDSGIAQVFFNGQALDLRYKTENNQGKPARGATIAFFSEDGKIVQFGIATCSGAEKNFDKYRGKKEALAKLLQYSQFSDRAYKRLIWAKFFEAFGRPRS